MDYPRQNFFSKFLKRPHMKGFAFELGRLLPDVATAATIEQEAIKSLYQAHGMTELTGGAASVIKVHFSKIAECATADDLSRNVAERLIKLAESIGVDTHEISESLRLAAKRQFRRAFEEVVSASRVDPRKREAAIEFGKSMGISDDHLHREIESVVRPIIKNKLSTVLEDAMISPDETREIEKLAVILGVNLTFDSETDRILDLARTRWDISQGNIPVADSPLMLKRGETCHAAVKATAYESRTRTVRAGYSGVSTRIKIVKGVYYNVGSYKVSKSTESYTHKIGSGNFVITDKRVLFSSPDKNLSFALDSIVDWTLFSDGIEIVRATGKPVTYVFGEGNGLFLEILIAARQKYIG